jgi:hypothetical protein
MSRLPTALALAALATLAACAPLKLWYKPGATVAASDDRLLRCRTRAAQKIPVNTQTRRTPVQIVPRRVCDSDGDCNVYYDRIGGETIIFDANEDLREDVVAQCMRRGGYTPVSIPPCPDSLRATIPAGRTETLPRLTEAACVIRNRDGSWQIVNRGG